MHEEAPRLIGPKLVAEQTPGPDAEDWYANLLWFDRRKCLLMTHSATLFTIFEPNVSASGLRATDRLVTSLIERELRSEGLPSRTFAGPEPGKVILVRTADRSVLGCTNDMAFHCEIAIADSGGLGHTDIAELNQSLRRNINSARGYRPHNRAGHRAPRHRVRQTSAATTTAASIFGLTRRAWVAAARSEQADGKA